MPAKRVNTDILMVRSVPQQVRQRLTAEARRMSILNAEALAIALDLLEEADLTHEQAIQWLLTMEAR